MNILFRFFFLAVLASSLIGCAQKTPKLVITTPAPAVEAEQVWKKYIQQANNTDIGAPFSITTSFRFKTPDASSRATMKIWGNGDSPVRIDILGPFGSVVASIRSGEDRLVIFEPDAKQAAFTDSGKDVLVKLGLPIPVSIHNILDLLKSNYGPLFPQQYETAYLEGTDNIAFTFSASQYARPTTSVLTDGILIVTKEGLPVAWKQFAPEKLSIEFDKYTDGKPDKIKVASGSKNSAIFLIKERSTPAVPYSPQALDLELPSDTKLIPLSVDKQ